MDGATGERSSQSNCGPRSHSIVQMDIVSHVIGGAKDMVMKPNITNVIDGAMEIARKPKEALNFLRSAEDEEEVRAAQQMQQDRIVACAELKSRMRKNIVHCKQHFADAKRMLQRVEASYDDLHSAVSGAVAAEEELKLVQQKAKGDCLIQESRPRWNDTIAQFKSAVKQAADRFADAADTSQMARLVCEHLLLGEPRTKGAAVVLFHPSGPKSELLKVLHAAGTIEMESGQVLRYAAKKKSRLAAAALEVVATGNPILSNPHGMASGAETFSIIPMYSSLRHCIGAIVSGPDPVPDEFLERMSRTSAQLFERIGRLELVWQIIKCVELFILQQCEAEHRLVYVKFERDAVLPPCSNEWAWQPLKYTSPTNEKRFELELRWSQGEPIGVFSVECATFTSMDEQLIALLHTVAPIMLDAVRGVETMELGTEPPITGMASVMAAYDTMQLGITQILSEELSSQVRGRILDTQCKLSERTNEARGVSQVKMSGVFSECMVETASYISKVNNEEVLNVAKAALALANFPAVKTQAEVAKQMKNTRALCEALSSAKLTLGPTGEKKQMKRQRSMQDVRWNRADACLKGISLDDLARRTPVPVQVLIRWLKVARTVQRIAIAMAMPKLGPEPSAQKLFEDIDGDSSKPARLRWLPLLSSCLPHPSHSATKFAVCACRRRSVHGGGPSVSPEALRMRRGKVVEVHARAGHKWGWFGQCRRVARSVAERRVFARGGQCSQRFHHQCDFQEALAHQQAPLTQQPARAPFAQDQVEACRGQGHHPA